MLCPFNNSITADFGLPVSCPHLDDKNVASYAHQQHDDIDEGHIDVHVEGWPQAGRLLPWLAAAGQFPRAVVIHTPGAGVELTTCAR